MGYSLTTGNREAHQDRTPVGLSVTKARTATAPPPSLPTSVPLGSSSSRNDRPRPLPLLAPATRNAFHQPGELCVSLSHRHLIWSSGLLASFSSSTPSCSASLM